MHQDALDNAIILCFPGQFYQALVGVVAVSLEHTFHPTRSLLLNVILNTVWQESLDVDTSDGHMDNTNPDIIGQRSNERTAEPVGRCEACIRTAKGSRGFAPFAHLASRVLVGGREIHSRHQQETRPRAGQVSSFGLGSTFHIGLSETEEDVEILIYGS